MNDKTPPKQRQYTYTKAEHEKAQRHTKVLAEIKELIKPINNRLSKLRTDRLIKK